MTFPMEFQAVVLAAGNGSRMSEITSRKPKCLLPVGTRPLIWYPLYKLQTSGFTDALVIVLECEQAEIQNALERCNLTIKLDYISIPDDLEDLGTAGTLRHINARLKSDVIVVSCDFVSDVSLNGVLNTFRKHDASIATLLLHPHTDGSPVVVPGPKSKQKPERDLIGIDVQTDRIVFLASASDFETDITLPTGLLRKHTNLKMYSNLIDSHVYVLKNWVIKYLSSDKKFTSIKGDLLPHIIKKQLTRPQLRDSNMTTDLDDQEIYDLAKESDDVLNIRKASSYNDHIGDAKSAYHADSVRCYAFVAPKENFGVRVNTIPAFWSINNQIIDKWSTLTNDAKQSLQHPKAEIKSNQVDNRCVVWEDAKLAEKTSFKNSIIGNKTSIASFSRVFNSIVMDNVTLEEKVALENCIVCDGATIKSGSNLKGCLVGSYHTVAENSSHVNEMLTEADQMMQF